MFRRLVYWILNRVRGHGLAKKVPGASYFIRAFSRRSAVIHGFPIELDPSDSLGLSLFGNFEPEETALVESVVKPGEIAVDVGAFIGYYTLLLSKLVGPSGRVIAFEPAPSSCALLRQNVSTNGLANVTIENAAVGATSGKGALRLNDNPLDNHTETGSGVGMVPIDVVALDEFFREDQSIDFVKMDIQGAEPAALRGMERLLARSPNVRILTEFWPAGIRRGGGDPDAFLAHLRSLGFSFAKELPGTGGSVYFYCTKTRPAG